MKHYAGLDVSLKEISICVVDGDGKTIARGACAADPEGVAGWLRNRSLRPQRIVHESGMLSIWLQRGLAGLGLPATCIDARKAHKSLSARLNKSDAADAEGLAQLARTGWFTPVHIRSEESDRLRSLVGARERLIRLRKDLEGYIRLSLAIVAARLNTLCDQFQKCVHIIQKSCNARAADTVADEASVAVACHKPTIQKTPEMVGNVWLRQFRARNDLVNSQRRFAQGVHNREAARVRKAAKQLRSSFNSGSPGIAVGDNLIHIIPR
jgi:hypothetical protein